MSLTAVKLSKTGTRSREVDASIRELLLMVDGALGKAAPVWGINEIQVELPQSFSLPGIEKKDAQRIVYSTIVSNLKERGFTVGLQLNEKTILFIGWVREFSDEELEAMNKIIKNSLVSNPEDFRRRVSTSAPVRTVKPNKSQPDEAAAIAQIESTRRGELPAWAGGS